DPAAEPLGRLPDIPTLTRALLVGVVACMLNPHHVRVWGIPFELAGSSAAEADAQLAQLLLSPLDRQFSERSQFGANLNGLAYAVLLVGGGAVLGLGAGRVRIADL